MKLADDEVKKLLALAGGVFYASQAKAVAGVEGSRHVVVWHKDNTTTRYDSDDHPIAYAEGDEIELVPSAHATGHPSVHTDNL